jgi:TonB family protein
MIAEVDKPSSDFVLFRGTISSLPHKRRGPVLALTTPAVYFDYTVEEVLWGHLTDTVVHALYVSEPPCGPPKLAFRAKAFVLCLDHSGPGTYCLNPVAASEENFRKIRSWIQQGMLRQRKVSVSAEQATARLIHRVKPDYSSIAKLAKVQGDVVLQILINPQGKVVQTQVMSGPPLLLRDAIDAVLQWRYKPFFLDGSPVRAETSVRVHFSFLDNKDTERAPPTARKFTDRRQY